MTSRLLSRVFAFALAALAALALAPAQAYFVPRHQAAWPALTNSSSYTPACSRVMFPIATVAETTYVSFLTHTLCVSPNYSVNTIRILIANFYVTQSGAQNPEMCPGNPVNVDFVTVFIAGVAYPVTFGGSLSIAVGNCGFVWSDPLVNSSGAVVTIPANASYYVRVSKTVASGGTQVANGEIAAANVLVGNPITGDAFGAYASPQTSLRTSGTVPATNGQGQWPSPVAMVVGKGWDGSAVYALVGDSVGYGTYDSNFNAPYVSGAEMRAFADSGSGLRNFLPLAFQGTKPDDQSSIASGQYQLRMRALRSIGNVPFNQIFSEMGQNSPAIANPPGLPAFQTAMGQWWQFWRGACPACRIFQATFPAHAAALNNTSFTTLADQTSDYPNGVRWQADNWIKGLAGPALPSFVTGIDLTTAFTIGSGYTESPGDWPTTGGWSGTLAAALTGGAYTYSVSVNAASAPAVGDNLVLEPGSSNSESFNIATVSGSSSPYTIGTVQHPANNHSAGAAVGTSLTFEGTHPAYPLYQAAANALIALKNSGVLP
jgi:hypothetical protein